LQSANLDSLRKLVERLLQKSSVCAVSKADLGVNPSRKKRRPSLSETSERQRSLDCNLRSWSATFLVPSASVKMVTKATKTVVK
jgi:hypothetical protein